MLTFYTSDHRQSDSAPQSAGLNRTNPFLSRQVPNYHIVITAASEQISAGVLNMDVSSGEREGTFNDGHHHHHSLSLLVRNYQSLPRDIACNIERLETYPVNDRRFTEFNAT